MIYTGVVESRNDPLKLGRCQVRIVGLHSHDKNLLKTEDLPWAYPLQPITSAGISGIGQSPLGPVEGSWVCIIFRDEDQQQPIMIGTIGGIPQNIAFVFDVDDFSADIKNPETNEIVAIPTDENSILEQTTPQDIPISQTPPNTDIPRVPPPDWTGKRNEASAGIVALLKACDSLGMTTREQKSAVLGIVGGECGWIPKKEAFNYSAEGLQQTFPRTFRGKPELAQQYARWKGSREDFFRFVYAPENNGFLVGNTQPDDGAKFYGRGFIQLTGRPNYEKYAQLSGVDIVNNPDLLNTNIDLSAKVAVAFIKDKVKIASNAHPEYFYAAKKAVNPNDNLQPKLAYYEYFYGVSAPESNFVDKGLNQPVSSSEADRVLGIKLGFKDPNDKYPLKQYIAEPDTNRLARGIISGTVQDIKDSKRVVNIPKADGSTYSQPKISFGGVYPFNHVIETESGHVIEYDDTPNKERIHQYHRKGTFTEIDENGTEVHRIVGDSYTIVDRNGCIYITGEGNLTVDGNINILCRSDANIKVDGDTTMDFGGNLDIKVANNMNVSVGGQYTVWSQGNANFQTGSNMNIRAGDKYGVDANRVDMNSGTTQSRTLPIISRGAPLRNKFEYLTTMSNSVNRVLFEIETEDEWNTPQGRRALSLLQKEFPIEEIKPIDQSPQSGGINQIVPANCDLIFATEEFTSNYRLSENITLGMLFDGGFNVRHKLVAQNGLSVQQIVCNLSQLCQNVIEPVINILPGGINGINKQWKISSGYRQGVSGSQHNKGQAVDFALSHNTPNRKQATYELITQIEKIVPYDQIILEYRGTSENWIHISFDSNRRRKQAFTMVNDKTYPQRGATGFILI